MEQVITKKSFNPIIFVSDFRGFTPQDQDGKPICRFSPFAVDHPEKGQISKGHYICRDEEIYDKLVWFMNNTRQKSMKIVKKLPRHTDANGMILRGVATGIAGDKQPNLQTLDQEDMALLRQLGQLENKYYTEDSGFTKFKGNIREDSRERITERVTNIKNKLKMD
jgi:hypothetical protein